LKKHIRNWRLLLTKLAALLVDAHVAWLPTVKRLWAVLAEQSNKDGWPAAQVCYGLADLIQRKPFGAEGDRAGQLGGLLAR